LAFVSVHLPINPNNWQRNGSQLGHTQNNPSLTQTLENVVWSQTVSHVLSPN
jgi:hypothetical protein